MSIQHDFSPLDHTFEYPMTFNGVKYSSVAQYLSTNKYSRKDLKCIIKEKFNNTILMSLLHDFFDQNEQKVNIRDKFNASMDIYKELVKIKPCKGHNINGSPCNNKTTGEYCHKHSEIASATRFALKMSRS